MTYRCARCGEVLNELPKRVIRCPSCAYRILFKEREPITKKVKAR